jgi:molybdopterin biosynthesis enzyme
MSPMLSFDEALRKLLAAARPVAESRRSDRCAAGRVLARAQVERLDVPPLDNSAMDGYAVRTADVPAAGTACRSPAHPRRQPSARRWRRHGGAHLHRRAGAGRAPTRW